MLFAWILCLFLVHFHLSQGGVKKYTFRVLGSKRDRTSVAAYKNWGLPR
jgi:hypothetical protein